MKHLKTVAFLTIVFSGLYTSAQQLPQFTQYMYNTISVNPAYAGSRGALNSTALHRNQWSGLEGNPTTTTFSIHAPLKNERIGVGLSYINDNLGYENTSFIYGDFSYTVPLSTATKLSFGLKGGVSGYNLLTPDANDSFFNSSFSAWSPNFGAGVYMSSDKWYAGVSTPRILNTDLNQGEFVALERNSYYAIGGLVFDLSENAKLKPTILTKFTNGAPITYDVSTNVLLYDKVWLGASYRFNDADNIGAMVDYQISSDMRLGYAYDMPTADIRPYSEGTHEVILIYEFASKKPNKYKSPRYF